MSPIKRFLARVAFVAAAAFSGSAYCTDFTDVWFVPGESGWGVNVVQSDNFLFVTFFIYDRNLQPTWYTAQLTWDGTRYSGGLYATQGSFWAGQWNPGQHPDAQQVGTAYFQPDASNAYGATLFYSANGVGSATKHVVRLSLTPIAVAGRYIGGQSGSYSNCTTSANNTNYTDKYVLNVTQGANNAVAFTFNYDSGATCTLTGTVQQFGQIYDMPGAAYACTGTLSLTTTATVYELKATAQGLEGRISANLPNGCQENAAFSGVLF